MANDGSKQDAVWPLPKFNFEVDLGTGLNPAVFQEVSGMDTETQVIEYRHGNKPIYSKIKMPGIKKFGNITLKRGMMVNNDVFWNWYNGVRLNTVKRATVVIRLLDEAGKPTMQWQLHEAWPTKITATDMKSDDKEVAIETLELACEKITVG